MNLSALINIMCFYVNIVFMNGLFSKNNPFMNGLFLQPIVATNPLCVCGAVTAVTFSHSHIVPLKKTNTKKRKSFKYVLLLQ